MKPLNHPAKNQEIEDAFKFARDLASKEIESIERLHRRTILSLLAVVGTFTFIGYSQLSEIVKGIVKTEVHRQVSAQIEDQLKKEHVQDTVRAIIENLSREDIQNLVRGDVTPAVQQEVTKQLPLAIRTEVQKELPSEVKRAIAEANIPNFVGQVARSEALGQAKSPVAQQSTEIQQQLAGRFSPITGMTGTYRTIHSSLLASGQTGKAIVVGEGADARADSLVKVLTLAGWKVDFRDSTAYQGLQSSNKFLVGHTTSAVSTRLAAVLLNAIRMSFDAELQDSPSLPMMDQDAVVLIYPRKK